MPAGHGAGCSGHIQQHKRAAADVAAVGLPQQRRAIACRAQAGAVVEEAPVAAAGGAPHQVTRAFGRSGVQAFGRLGWLFWRLWQAI
jgi:hypothetical protein